MLHVYIFHGFKSDSSAMKRFVLFEEEIREGIAKITGIKPRSIENCAFYNRTWGVMKKSSKLSYLYNVLFNSETYPLEVHEEWDKAIETIEDDYSSIIANRINSMSENDHVLFVGHSMGTYLIAEVIPKIKNDITLNLFFMGGIVSKNLCELLFDDERIRCVVNLFSRSDVPLERFLEEMSGFFDEPVGINSIEHKKAINKGLSISHSGYLEDTEVIDMYRMFVAQLVRYQ
ncbi:hypothetical protein G9H14_10645 [Klebsiella pneumoniae]|uniref:Uncharacterized protein n=1 Tax=Klebsiella pneumoniae TaxID=573 RepID=A0A3P2EHB5_KLEPN|nr:hypothetical protein [Klebsiella pneumoniae]HDE1470634.1 hypothetical protein [Klebsiella quasipneumoniae]MBA1487269.1 hypothetical protein [Klebsiella pneumoniae]MCS6680127.1 hypothetical protein [Klebsiella pneumoniae subsp. pneumoniae]MDU5929711.1 hypothetical protein [Klebsiella pneumoniae]NAO12523.1 hypothetical protein [Klebsiella pneumoniae]